MADFGPSSHAWAKFLNAINLKPYKLWPWHFQHLLFSSVSIIGQNFKEMWDIKVTFLKKIGWFDMELPFMFWIFQKFSFSNVYVRKMQKIHRSARPWKFLSIRVFCFKVYIFVMISYLKIGVLLTMYRKSYNKFIKQSHEECNTKTKPLS